MLRPLPCHISLTSFPFIFLLLLLPFTTFPEKSLEEKVHETGECMFLVSSISLGLGGEETAAIGLKTQVATQPLKRIHLNQF